MVGLRGSKHRVFGPAALSSPVARLYGLHPAATAGLRRKKCLILAQSQRIPANLRRTTANSVVRHVLVAAASKRVLEEVDYRAIYLGTDFDTVTETFLWERLSGILSYLPEKHLRRVREGLRVAYAAHDGQRRKSGEPFITHPVEVARLLGEIRMDADTVIAGLLHDTVEDTEDVTFDSIEVKFGPAVRNIVEGETKLSKIAKLTSSLEQDCKARDLMQLFLSMTKEVRVIIVKLTDRLHNMRTLDSMKPEKQKKIAEETMNVFVPLARLLGLYCVKEELEDLSFKYLEPVKYDIVSKALLRVSEKQEAVLLRAQEDLLMQLKGDKVLAAVADGFEVRLRTKSTYAAYKENIALKKPLKDVQSAVNLQVIVNPSKNFLTCGVDELSRQVCYLVLCTVHGIWRPIPGTLVDYVAHPKMNGYQSIHTRVVPITVLKDPNCQLVPIDVQIRTRDMDLLAHFGIVSKNFGGGTAFKHVCMDGMSLATYRRNGSYDDELLYSDAAPGGSSAPPPPSTVSAAPPALNGNGRKHGGLAVELLKHEGPPLNSNGNGRGPYPSLKPLFDQGMAKPQSYGGAPTVAPATVTEPSSSSQRPLPLEELGKFSVALAALLCLRRSGMLEAALRAHRDTPAAGAGSTNWWSNMSSEWMTSIKKWTELSGVSATEFVDGVTNDVLNSKVVVFTPEGERKNLPQGSTCVDFAYLLHSELGDSMRAARVNCLFVRPEHTLSSGDIVEILKDPLAPSPASVRRHAKWAAIVQTRKARLHIRQFLKNHAELLGSDVELDLLGDAPADGPGAGVVVADGTPADPGLSGPAAAGTGEGGAVEPAAAAAVSAGRLQAAADAAPGSPVGASSETISGDASAMLLTAPPAAPEVSADRAEAVAGAAEEPAARAVPQRSLATAVCETVAAVHRGVRAAVPLPARSEPVSHPVDVAEEHPLLRAAPPPRPISAAVCANVAAVLRAVPAATPLRTVAEVAELASHALDVASELEEVELEVEPEERVVAGQRPVAAAVCANVAAVLRAVPAPPARVAAAPPAAAAERSVARTVVAVVAAVRRAVPAPAALVEAPAPAAVAGVAAAVAAPAPQRPVSAAVCANVAAVLRGVPAAAALKGPPAPAAATKAAAEAVAAPQRSVAAAVCANVAAVLRGVPAAAPVPAEHAAAATASVEDGVPTATAPAAVASAELGSLPTGRWANTLAVATAPPGTGASAAAVPRALPVAAVEAVSPAAAAGAPGSPQEPAAQVVVVTPSALLRTSADAAAGAAQRSTLSDDLAVVGFALMAGLTYLFQVLPLGEVIEQLQVVQ